MDGPSHFAFVEADDSPQQTISKNSAAKSLIRSHAMQQVWEQRRLKRAQGRQDSESDVILANRGQEGPGKPELETRRHVSEAQRTRGAAQAFQKNLSRRGSRPSRTDEAVESGKSKRPVGVVEVLLEDSSEALHEARGWSTSVHIKRRAASSSGNSEGSSSVAKSTSPSSIGLCLMDPFDTCSLSLGAKESHYMNHYFQALSWRFTMPKKTWLRYAIHDPGLLHGVLAIAAAHYSFATIGGLSNDAIYHHGKTIAHVQDCLINPSLRFSDGVIGAICRMAICHLIFGSRQHFITHMKALQRCAETRGGLESLGMTGQLKYIIATCVAGAATIWWDCVPLQSRCPYGPLEYPAVEDIPDAEPHDPEWGSAFRELHRTGFLPDTLLDICEAILALNSVIHSRRSWTEPRQRIYGDQCNKLSLRLAYLRESEAKHCRDETPGRYMRECIRLVAHFYVSSFQRDVPLLSNLSIQILQMLTETLYRTDLENCWGGGLLGEACLWVLIISGAGCVRPQDRACVGAQLRKTVVQLGVTEWSEVKRICRKFIYLDSALDRRTWPLWKDYGFNRESHVHLPA